MIPFQSTVWAEIDRARRRDPAAYLKFVNRYRPAVVSFLRSQGFNREDAEDLAQESFLYIVQGDVLSKVDPKKGKFRNLILAVTKNVMKNEWRRRNTVKRGKDLPKMSLDDSDLPVVDKAEEEAFDLLWAQQIVAAALRELSVANPAYHEALRRFLDGRSQQEIAREMDKSVTEVNNYVHRAKAWVNRAARKLIAEYCANDREFREELDRFSRFIPDDGRV
jgi:RNA polymerase sigma factor (sigma-70 family)